MGTFISLTATDGRLFQAFLATPANANANANGRGLVVLPEVYNVNTWVRGVADRYASSGYTVLVPDLFWRQRPGAFYEYDQPEPARAQGQEVDVDAVVGDVGVAAATLRRILGQDTRVGVIGYCLGGRLALLAGVREPVDAVVSYYGVQLDQHLPELAELQKPAILHFGDEDPWVPKEAVAAVSDVLKNHSTVAIHTYDGAGHGFDRDGNAPYRPAAAELAALRTQALFDRVL